MNIPYLKTRIFHGTIFLIALTGIILTLTNNDIAMVVGYMMVFAAAGYGLDASLVEVFRPRIKEIMDSFTEGLEKGYIHGYMDSLEITIDSIEKTVVKKPKKKVATKAAKKKKVPKTFK